MFKGYLIIALLAYGVIKDLTTRKIKYLLKKKKNFNVVLLEQWQS